MTEARNDRQYVAPGDMERAKDTPFGLNEMDAWTAIAAGAGLLAVVLVLWL